MAKNKSAILIKWGVVLLSGMGVVCTVLFLMQNKSARTTSEMQLRLTYTLKNTSGELIPSADFTALMPLEIPDVQHVVSIEATQPHAALNDSQHNIAQNAIKFEILNFPPYAAKVITVTVHIIMASEAQNKVIDKNKYLRAQQFVELESSAVRTIAAQVKQETPVLTMRAAYEWLVNNIQDVGFLADLKGAQFTLEQHAGDCTEHMYALIALARANGIPARGVAGFKVDNAVDLLTTSNYHNWAEFYDGKKWILVDSQKQNFDKGYGHYVVTRFLAEGLDTSNNAERFISSDRRIEISL